MDDCSRCKSERALMKLQGIGVSYCDLCGKKLVNKNVKTKVLRSDHKKRKGRAGQDLFRI